jgi:metal-sulfur cluster biosynthetic enzyme
MVDESKLSPLERELFEKLREVVDPEFGFSIVDRGLIDEVKIEGTKAKIVYHLTVPFCPPVFALHIGKEIKKKALSIPGVETVEVRVQRHMQEAMINEELEKEE